MQICNIIFCFKIRIMQVLDCNFRLLYHLYLLFGCARLISNLIVGSKTIPLFLILFITETIHVTSSKLQSFIFRLTQQWQMYKQFSKTVVLDWFYSVDEMYCLQSEHCRCSGFRTFVFVRVLVFTVVHLSTEVY